MLDQKDLNEEMNEQEAYEENRNADEHPKENIENEELIDSSAETSEKEFCEDEETPQVKSEKVSFLRSLEAIIVDEVVVAFISIALMYIFEGALKLFDLYISEKLQMLVILYFIVTILYFSIMEGTKGNNTIGKKLSFIKVVKNDN